MGILNQKLKNVNKTINDLSDSQRGMRFLISTAALVIIIAGINLAQSIVVLFLVSFFMAILATPPLLWLKSKRIPSGFAVLIVMSAMIIVLLLIGAQILPLVIFRMNYLYCNQKFENKLSSLVCY